MTQRKGKGKPKGKDTPQKKQSPRKEEPKGSKPGPKGKRSSPEKDPSDRKESPKKEGSRKDRRSKSRKLMEQGEHKQKNPRYRRKPGKKAATGDQGLTRLNKYIAHAGICSRREADDLIASGAVKVNGQVVTELGTKVSPKDKVQYGGETLNTEKKVYVLLNKPKDHITTTEDDRGRRTVMHLVRNACRERIYPVGRLDRNTTGLLLFTNDGELAKKLTHPKHRVIKIYHVEVDRNVKENDLKQLIEGIQLEDEKVTVDNAAYVGSDRKQVGVELHSGQNRVVRRLFEALGYDVRKLDRVMYGNLTKKDLPRGKWRYLSEKEVGQLKMLPKGDKGGKAKAKRQKGS